MMSSPEFEATIRRVYEYICEWGVKSITYKILTKKGNEEIFMIKSHEGFREGQTLILNNLIEIERQKFDFLNKLKLEKNKPSKDAISNNLKVIDVRERIFRKLADSIAWQLIRGHHFIARRLYQNETYPSLLSKGIEEVIRRVNEINTDPFKFALISDLTSFVQVGDIVIVSVLENSFILVEVKSGKMNSLAFEYLKKYNGNVENIANNEDIDKNFLKQIKRIKTQEERREITNTLIVNEGGTNPITGNNYRTIEGKTELISYNDVIIQSIKNLREKDWDYNHISYGNVGPILHIGAYKNLLLRDGKDFIKAIIESKTENYMTVSYASNIYVPISLSIFLMNLPTDLKFDLLMGRIAVYLGLDLDNLIALFNETGASAKWLSRKESQLIKETAKEKSVSGVFYHKDRAIGIKILDEAKKSVLGDGIITRILSDNIHPISAVEAFIEMINEEK